MSILIIVATQAEADFFNDLPARFVVSGVGATAAAVAAAMALAGQQADLVVSAGIAGAYPSSGLLVGEVAISSHIVQADLGFREGGQWRGLQDIGLSVLPGHGNYGVYPSWAGAKALAGRIGAGFGTMLTLATVTASREEAEFLERRYPDALSEGMEGAGVAHAALVFGVPSLEIRGISNMAGPRDRDSWRIPQALASARAAIASLIEGKF